LNRKRIHRKKSSLTSIGETREPGRKTEKEGLSAGKTQKSGGGRGHEGRRKPTKRVDKKAREQKRGKKKGGTGDGEGHHLDADRKHHKNTLTRGQRTPGTQEKKGVKRSTHTCQRGGKRG